MIHFKVNDYLVADGKWREFVDKTRRLIVKEVNHMPDGNIFVNSLSATSKTLSASHLFNDSNDGMVELFKGEQLEHI
jgi:hypothetical protein